MLLKHTPKIISERTSLEALIFCIVSQSLPFERASTFIKNTVQKQKDISDPQVIHQLALATGLRFREDRFSPVYEYLSTYSGGIVQLGEDFLANPYEVRHELFKKVNYLGLKTASFWNLSLGGKDLMTIDIHNIRQLQPLLPQIISDDVVISQMRKTDGRKVNKGLTKKEYLTIEKETLELMKKISPKKSYLLQDSGEINTAFLTGLFWWTGVKIDRGIYTQNHEVFTNTSGYDLIKNLPF